MGQKEAIIDLVNEFYYRYTVSLWGIKHSAPCPASLFYYLTTTAAVQEQLYHLNTTAILGVYYLNATAILELLY